MTLRRRRTALITAAVAMATAAAAGGLVTAFSAQAATGCQVSYSIASQWPGGFGANITITNYGDPINGWTLNWTFAAGQSVTQSWGFTANPASGAVTARNVSYNGTIAANASVSIGFQATHNGNSGTPTSFTLNGTACAGP
jgi:pectate lyase